MVLDPFTPHARFDFERFKSTVAVAVRMLDNVLDETVWPLPEQGQEAANKRRVGLGYTGLGDVLVMLGLPYNTEEAREMASTITSEMRNAAYMSSVEIAMDKGAFPLFDAEKYLAAPRFASRLPADIQEAIKQFGIRNSHLLSIAPTGTISLAFADNASNGCEPPFSWTYTRIKRMPDGSKKAYEVEDHAYRVFRNLGGDVEKLLPSFVTALDISAMDHMLMVAAIAPYVDSAISKTVNVPVDYPREQFDDLYYQAWTHGLKGITTYRPNSITGAVLEVKKSELKPEAVGSFIEDADRRLVIKGLPEAALASLRWPGRPKLGNGNPSWTYMIEHPHGSFAVMVGHVQNGRAHPFEVWANGNEQPRGIGAVAKTLSMDMRAEDPRWMRAKLESLIKSKGDDFFDFLPPGGESEVRAPSMVSAFAQVIKHRIDELQGWGDESHTPIYNALFSAKEPKTTPDGTLSWSCDVGNHATDDDFVLFMKECTLPNGQRRPYSVWISGSYPRAMEGLCKLLSLDMRVIDPAWIGMKLKKLLNYREPLGDFLAKVPGDPDGKQQNYPSTVAYVAAVMLHRYVMLGILTREGDPVTEMGVLEKAPSKEKARRPHGNNVVAGAPCPECHSHSLVKLGGCEQCSACGYLGSCG